MKATLITENNFNDFAPYLVMPDGQHEVVCFGVRSDEKEIAGVMAVIAEPIWNQIFWIYVRPSFRRQGVGRLLIETARKELQLRGALPFSASFSEDMEGIGSFLKTAGFFVPPGTTYYEFGLKDAVGLYEKVEHVSVDAIRALSELDRKERKSCGDFLEEYEWSRELLLTDSVRLDLSFASFSEGRINGILVVSEEEEKVLRIDRVAAAKGNWIVFKGLLKSFILSVRQGESAGTRIRFLAENKKLEAVAIRYIGDGLAPIGHYFSAVG